MPPTMASVPPSNIWMTATIRACLASPPVPRRAVTDWNDTRPRRSAAPRADGRRWPVRRDSQHHTGREVALMNANAALQETIDQFVTAAHGNRAAVEAGLAADPSLINARSSLAESPLGAAAHVGNRTMAEYLLQQGATMELPAAAMLGHVAKVEAAVRADPSQANAA